MTLTRFIFGSLIAIFTAQAALAGSEIFAVVTHKSNMLETISKTEIRAIFLGDQAFWGAASQRVRAVRLADNSDLTRAFLSRDLGMTTDQFLLHWRRRLFAGRGIPPKVATSESELNKYIEENPNSIGFVQAGSLQQFGQLKELIIND